MTPKQFYDLREGDVIRNKDGHGYLVLRNQGPISGVLVQRTVSIHNRESWELVSRLAPVLPEPPTTCEMVRALDKAGWIYSECPDPRWIAPGDSGGLYYRCLIAAFKSLKG